MSILLGLLGAIGLGKQAYDKHKANEQYPALTEEYYRNQRLRQQDYINGMSLEQINNYTRAGRYKLPDVPMGREGKINMERYKRDIEVKGFQRAFDACVAGEYDLEKEQREKDRLKKWEELQCQKDIDYAEYCKKYSYDEIGDIWARIRKSPTWEEHAEKMGSRLGNKFRREHGLPEHPPFDSSLSQYAPPFDFKKYYPDDL